jgi:hypothetical protein
VVWNNKWHSPWNAESDRNVESIAIKRALRCQCTGGSVLKHCPKILYLIQLYLEVLNDLYHNRSFIISSRFQYRCFKRCFDCLLSAPIEGWRKLSVNIYREWINWKGKIQTNTKYITSGKKAEICCKGEEKNNCRFHECRPDLLSWLKTVSNSYRRVQSG